MSLQVEQFRQEFKVGDKILFVKGGQQDYRLYIGEVLDINEKGTVAFKSDSGRTLTRHKRNLWNIQDFIDSHPEYMV